MNLVSAVCRPAGHTIILFYFILFEPDVISDQALFNISTKINKIYLKFYMTMKGKLF
jgi:hypothetical protein